MAEKSKEVKLEAAKENGKSEKLTYEQLEQVAGNLNQQCNKLYQQLREAQGIISNFNEIEMLLAIIGKAEYFESTFIDRCTKEIQKVVTAALDASEKQEEEEKKN